MTPNTEFTAYVGLRINGSDVRAEDRVPVKFEGNSAAAWSIEGVGFECPTQAMSKEDDVRLVVYAEPSGGFPLAAIPIRWPNAPAIYFAGHRITLDMPNPMDRAL